jgi:hypothetical protein
MIRAVLGAVLAMLAVAPAVAGASIGLRDDLAATEVALAGPEVLIARAPDSGGVQLRAVPRAGGAGRTLLSVSSPRAGSSADVSLAASDERVALIVELRGRFRATIEWRVYSGPPAGPVRLVRRTADRGQRTWVPYIVDVDGDRVLLVEARLRSSGRVRAQLLGPDGPVSVRWTSGAFAPVAIAGEHAAVFARRPRRLAVADLVSGAEQGALDANPSALEMLDIRADGRLIAQTRAGLVTTRPGEASRTLPGSKGLRWPRFAGAAVAGIDDGRPVLLGGDGARQVLGEPSNVLADFAADDRGITWLANGCVRYAALRGPPTASQAADPCPATEIGLYLIADSRLHGRRVRAPVRCVTAPGDACRGTLLARRRGRLVGRGRFTVPVATERWVTIRLTRAAAAHARRDHGTSLAIAARMPDGRVGAGRGDSELTVKVR